MKERTVSEGEPRLCVGMGKVVLSFGLHSSKDGGEMAGVGREKCLQDRYTSVRFSEFWQPREQSLNFPIAHTNHCSATSKDLDVELGVIQ